jgi:lipopolysaccharide/colanic/teichoic acid biosynthesis glycosyltransferase
VNQSGIALVIKRSLDVCGATVALVILGPLIALIGIALFVTIGRPVLFRQLRPGRGGVPFMLVKFRTMRNVPSGDYDVANDGVRLTRLGRLLREHSLDELPELFNILGGTMSFVGPRPLLMSYLPLYSAEQRRRHEVLPGLTGWAQINGRNSTTWHDRFRHDVWYVEHWSPLLDLRILARTISTVIR